MLRSIQTCIGLTVKATFYRMFKKISRIMAIFRILSTFPLAIKGLLQSVDIDHLVAIFYPTNYCSQWHLWYSSARLYIFTENWIRGFCFQKIVAQRIFIRIEAMKPLKQVMFEKFTSFVAICYDLSHKTTLTSEASQTESNVNTFLKC